MKPGKVTIRNENHSSIEVIQGNDYLHGESRSSPNKDFLLVFKDGYIESHENSNKWISGKVCLIKNNDLLWIKDIDGPSNATLSDSGRIVLLHTPKEKELDLGGTLSIMEKSGEILFKSDFHSNIEGCAISPDGNLVCVSTLKPDDSIYCFDVGDRKLLWKYKNHSRKVVLGLEFNGNEILVSTGHSLATREKEYALLLDGILTPEFEKELETLKKIKKQRPEEKVNSLISMLNSMNKDDAFEGLSLLESFVTTKGSVPHYGRIVSVLGSHLRDGEGIFYLILKVVKKILKNKPVVLEPLVPQIISWFKDKQESYHVMAFLDILGKFGGANPSWIRPEEQFIKEKLRSSKFWNERRYAALALGSIGCSDPSLVKDIIPVLIDYAAHPEKTRMDLENQSKDGVTDPVKFSSQTPIGVTDFSVDLKVTSSMDLDGPIWIRDACIDALGMIGNRSPESVRLAIPLLENLSKEAPSPYTIKKALRAIDSINGKCKETFRHSV